MPDTGRIDTIIDAVDKHLSMDELLATLAAIRDLDRWFTFPKFLESAHRTADELRRVGCDEAEVVELPADGRTTIADFTMPLAWDVAEATLEIISPDREARVLARRSDEPNVTVMWCGPTPPEGLAGGVVLWDAIPPAERAAVDLTGKFLYTRSKPANVKAAAVKGGALGVIGSYGFGHRSGEFADCVCWNNAWSETSGWAMTAADRALPGFNISPAQGEELERLVNETPELTLRATADARLYEGVIPAVSGLMRGASDDAVVMIGHQFEIGANDNASGCAAIVEAARCVRRMVDAGDLPALRRSARFITCSEMYSSVPLPSERPDIVGKLFAGLNLDMICPYKGYDSPMDFYQSPDANPAFGDDLLEWILRRVWERHNAPWAWKRMPTQLSDNCWCDPYVGVPFSWLSWHGREFWHSSGDTMERLVPEAIRDVATAAITWLAFLLTASDDDVAWLAERELAEARERLADADEDHRDYVLMRELMRLESIRRLGETDAAERFAAEQEPPEPVAVDPDDEAARAVPVRRCAAPLTFSRVPQDAKEFSSPLWSAFLNSALYWADGERSVREIERLTILEHRRKPPVDLLAWFRFLEKYGYVELIDVS